MSRFSKLLVLLLVLLALLSGCKRKKPPVPPAQGQAPTLSPPPPAEKLPHPQTAGQPPSLPPVQPPPANPKPKKSLARRHQPKPEPPRPESSENKPEASDTKAPPPNGGTEGGAQLAAGLPARETLQQRQDAAQLRTSAENTVKGLNRTLSADEQAMVQQIHSYLQQSRAAETEGDTERAYNLAYKAHLLCDELNKH
jgi:outer membrane biosynthesis protein TonB